MTVSILINKHNLPSQDGAGEVAGAAAGDEEDRHAVHEQSAKWKQELMRNFEERVRIKRRLIDLANLLQNQMVEKSHAQVGISQWEAAQAQGGHAAELGTPPPISDLQERLETIKQEMVRTEETTQGLETQLVENQRQAEKLHTELPKRVQNADMRNFLGLVSRIYVMEVENLDIQEMNDVAAPLLMQKDLEAEALRLQIQMRDRMIEEQTQVLAGQGHSIAEKPEGWIDVSSMPAGKQFTQCPFRWHGAAGDVGGQPSPARRDRGASGRHQRGGRAPGQAGSLPPTSRERDADRSTDRLPPLSPTRRGNYALRVQPRPLDGNLQPVLEVDPAPDRERRPERFLSTPHGLSPANLLAQACYRPSIGGPPGRRRKKKRRGTEKELRDRAAREKEPGQQSYQSYYYYYYYYYCCCCRHRSYERRFSFDSSFRSSR